MIQKVLTISLASAARVGCQSVYLVSYLPNCSDTLIGILGTGHVTEGWFGSYWDFPGHGGRDEVG